MSFELRAKPCLVMITLQRCSAKFTAKCTMLKEEQGCNTVRLAHPYSLEETSITLNVE